MKRFLLGGLLLALCGCECMNNTEKGALAGGVIGTGLGTVVGGLTGHPLAGAAIGAGAGTLTGGVAGHSVDRAEARADARAAAQAQAIAAQNPPLDLQDVVRMAQQHISDAVIIQQIRTTNSVYSLTSEQITWLKQNGVSDTVVIEMQSRRPTVPLRVGAVAPATTSVYVVEPAPPPVSFGVGVGYGGGCWRRGW